MSTKIALAIIAAMLAALLVFVSEATTLYIVIKQASTGECLNVLVFEDDMFKSAQESGYTCDVLPTHYETIWDFED